MDYQCSLYPELEVLPCYSALPWEQQRLIFEESGKNKRKVKQWVYYHLFL